MSLVKNQIITVRIIVTPGNNVTVILTSKSKVEKITENYILN